MESSQPGVAQEEVKRSTPIQDPIPFSPVNEAVFKSLGGLD
jgi:hypothetical protein